MIGLGPSFVVWQAIQFVLLAWFTFVPIIQNIHLLWTLKGWELLYQFQLSNLDIFILVWIKLAILLALVGQTAVGTLKSSLSHTQGKRYLGLTCTAFQLFFLTKAAVVAIKAPAQVLPATAEHHRPFVGLLYMYLSICFAIFFTAVEGMVAKEAVRMREKSVRTAKLSDAESGLRAPLLAGSEVETQASTPALGKGVPHATGVEEDKGKVSSDTAGQLVRLTASYWPIIAVAFMAGSVAALCNAIIPYLSGKIIDYASIEPDRSKFTLCTIQLLICSFVCAIFSGIRGGLFTLAMAKLNVKIRVMLFHALLAMEIGFFDTTNSGDVTSRLNADTTTVSSQVCLNVNVLMRSATQAAMVLAFMFYASWRLTVITFILVPLILAISSVYGEFVSAISKKVQSELADANGAAQEVLASMTTVKSHAAEASSQVMYAAKLDKAYQLKLKEAMAYSLYSVLTTFLPNVVAAVVLFYGGNLVLTQEMSPGALVSFMLYHQSLSSAFTTMGDIYSSLTSAVGAADKVMELIRRKPEIEEKGRLTLPEGLKGEIVMDSVKFSYPARPHICVLNSLSLTVRPGETVALVGASGGGKSSIVKLLERFYVPQAGSILIDGREIGMYDAKWLRRKIALVSQEPVLYARSIKRNIVFGLEREDGCQTPSDEDIEEAAVQANAHDFIVSFPEGYETNCGEKGVQISGGQKQRIAIARALVRKPGVLLLDEATSALDADSEAVVQDALDRMMSSRTTLVIAHRLSTIQGADRIIVIGKGVAQEVGSHEELLEAGGVYASLIQRQINRTASTQHVSLNT